MQNYHPSITPKPEEWLELGEMRRIKLVLDYHRLAGIDFTDVDEELHAIIHVIVENQLAEQVKPVPATLKKLIRQGLSRHDAIHAIGTVLAEDIFEVIKTRKKHNIKRYRRRLEKLTAKKWLNGNW